MYREHIQEVAGSDQSNDAKVCVSAVSKNKPKPVELPKDIRALTGMRLFAALWVVVFHFREEFGALLPGFGRFGTIVNQGYQAVPLFFILSGFILSHTYFERYSIRKHGEFIYLRFARLWPVHLGTILVILSYLALLRIHSGRIVSENYPFSCLPSELAMVRCWFTQKLIWNYPAWSIHSEWFAYIFIFPFAFFCFRRAVRVDVLTFVAVALVGMHSFLPLGRIPGKCAEIPLLFLAGSAIYRIRVLLPQVRGKWALPAGALLLVAGLTTGNLFSRAFIHFAFALVIFGLTYGEGLLCRFLSSTPIVYGGSISYSLYMTHAVVGKFYGLFVHKLVLTSGLVCGLSFCALVGAILLAAVAFHHLVEVPCNQALRVRWGSLRQGGQ